MFDSHSLRSLSDQDIISGTRSARAQEHRGLLALISHLIEFERRRLHFKLGFQSLHHYCTAELGYCESSAIRRMTAARMVARFPEIYALLESRQVHLSAITRIAKVLTAENSAVLLARVRGKSLREIEAIVAEYDPETAMPRDRVKTIVVRVPIAVAAGLKMGPNHLRNGGKESSTVNGMTPEDHRAGNHEESPATTVASSGAAKFERRAVVQFTAREEVIGKLERVRSLASHRLRGNPSLEDVIELLADEFIKREDPVSRQKRREQRPQKASGNNAAGATKPSRSIPARVRDQVFVRDRQQCSYVGAGGKRCESTHVLQVDHIKPVARGGASTIDNLRVLCAYHNRLEAERLMGRCGPPGASH